MSLQELSGPTIHLKLSIREGHGFGFLKSPVVIVACINGISLETEIVSPSPDPLFQIDLVWETDKKNLRRFRASNTPIKIECFTVSSSKQREGIGSILLNIKSAQVVVGGPHKNVMEKWHRLIGVPPEAKALQPELLLSLTIQEPNSLSQPLLISAWEGEKYASHASSNEKSESVNEQSIPKTLSTSDPLPEYRQGFLLLGSENTCFDTFLLFMRVKRALEMEMLLHSHHGITTSASNSESFQVSFSVMGQSIKTKLFGAKRSEKEFEVNEEIVLPLRTSLPILSSYLQRNPSAGVSLLCCGQEVAASELHIRSLVPTTNIQSFTRDFGAEFALIQKCVLVSSSSGTVPSRDGVEPSIEVATRLQITSSLATPQKSIATPTYSKPVSETLLHPFVDEPSPLRSESRQSQDTFIVTSLSGPTWVPVAPDQGKSHPFLLISDTGVSQRENSQSKTVVIKVTPKQIEFYQLPEAAAVRFLFQCTDSSLSTSKLTDLPVAQTQGPLSVEGINAQISGPSPDCIHIHIFAVGTDLEILQHFASAKINLNLLNLEEKRGDYVSTELFGPVSHQSLGSLYLSVTQEEFSHEDLSVTQEKIVCIGTTSKHLSPSRPHMRHSGAEVFIDKVPESSSTVPMLKEVVSDVFMQTQTLKPENVSVHEALQLQNLHTAKDTLLKPASTQELTLPSNQYGANPVIPLDSGTAYKIVEELEDWKEKQQEMFLANLKEKEIEHVTKIVEEWNAQTKAQNAELDRKMEECKTLTESLSKAKQDLKERLKKCAVHEQELRRTKEELDLQYNLKFQELSLAAKQLEEGVKLKIALAETKFLKLEETIKELESENESLRLKLSQKSSLHSDHQMCGMSHSQVSQLLVQVDQLEGKLKASVDSKAYFKEQWGRAVREMNQAKLQFAQSSENNECLDNLLGKEEKELQNDQRTLEKLRQEIAHLNA